MRTTPYLFKTKESITIENIRRLPLIPQTEINGFEYIQNYFVDSSGFGQENETALTFNSFIDKIKIGFAYCINDAGQFQVNIGEFKPVKKTKETNYLKPIYDSRKDFYKKSYIITEENKLILYSYNTEVCYIKEGKAIILNAQSSTTKRHIKEFLLQNGFNIETIKQLIKDFNK